MIFPVITSLELASCQNFGFSGILEDQNKGFNIICLPITGPILVKFKLTKSST